MGGQLYEEEVAVMLWKVIPPILIVIGTLGNILCIAVLVMPKNRKTSTAVFLIALAVTDILILNIALLRQWLQYLFKFEVRTVHSIVCQIHVLMTYSCIQFASLLLVLITSERVLSVLFPHSVRVYCTRRRSVFTVLAVLVCVLAMNSHCFTTFEVKFIQRRGRSFCKPVESQEEFFYSIWPWIDFSIVFALPFIILVVGNITILVKLRASHKFRASSAQYSASGQSNSRHDNGNHRIPYLSVVMLTLNTAFLLFVSPMAIFAVGQKYWWLDPNEHEVATLELVWAVVNMFMYSNSTINFMLYILAGSRFRNDVKRMLLCMRDQETQVNGSSSGRQRPVTVDEGVGARNMSDSSVINSDKSLS